MANKKVLSYEDKKFDQGNSLVSCLQQAFVDLKAEKQAGRGWNLPIANLDGVTMKIVNNDRVCLTYHRVESGTAEDMTRLETGGKKYLKEVEKELKSRFKKLTGKTLELKKISDDQNFEQYGRMQADTSWMVGSNRSGYNSRPISKFFVKDTITYTYSADVPL